MGIERFFSSIEKNNITNIDNSFTNKLNNKLDTEALFIDFNSIVYLVKAKVISDLNKILYYIIIDKVDIIKHLFDVYDLDLSVNNLTVEQFKLYLTDDVINNIMIKHIIEYVFNMLKNYIISDNLKLLYIAIDGVPTKAKMIEQKKRRYMGELISLMKNKFFDKYENEIKKNNNRYLYEKNQIIWKTQNITPGTDFMNLLNDNFKSSNFETGILNICKNIKKYIYSGPYQHGEGENKIVNYIRSNSLSFNSYVIYSPDSDVTLLGLLLNSKINPHLNNDTSFNNNAILNLSILRYNQQQKNYDVIHIDKLANNIFNYVNNNLDNDKLNNKLLKNCVINDIVFILTIFGNDFLPKIDAFNVKYDFNRIIDKYISVLNNNNFSYLINYSNNVRSINFNTFVSVIHSLHIDEAKNLNKMYMTSHYKNYNKLKNIFNEKKLDLTESLNNFLSKLRSFNDSIKNNIINNFFDFNSFINKSPNYKNLFIKYLKKVVIFSPTIKNFKLTDQEFITNYIDYYKKNKHFPQILIFEKFTNSIDDDFHRSNLERSVKNISPDFDITTYDKELYKFNNMLDQYKIILNAQKLNIGSISVDYDSYTFNIQNIDSGVKNYYSNFFDINDISFNNSNMTLLLDNYFTGLLWVFDYYFNHYDTLYHNSFVNVWFYPHTHAPLLTQLYNYIKIKQSSYFDDLFNTLNSHLINKIDDIYFNSLEQLMFVTPNSILDDLAPKEYLPFIYNNNFYPNLFSIVDNIWSDILRSSSVPNNSIDCRGVIFLTKCHLEALNTLSDFSHDKKFINSLRNIDISFDTQQKTGHLDKLFVVNFKNIIPLSSLSNN